MRKKLLGALGAAMIFLTGGSADAADNRVWDLDAMINPALRDDARSEHVVITADKIKGGI